MCYMSISLCILVPINLQISLSTLQWIKSAMKICGISATDWAYCGLSMPRIHCGFFMLWLNEVCQNPIHLCCTALLLIKHDSSFLLKNNFPLLQNLLLLGVILGDLKFACHRSAVETKSMKHVLSIEKRREAVPTHIKLIDPVKISKSLKNLMPIVTFICSKNVWNITLTLP